MNKLHTLVKLQKTETYKKSTKEGYLPQKKFENNFEKHLKKKLVS